MSTGVTVSGDVVSSFTSFKLKRKPHHCKYFIYKLCDDFRTIVVDKIGALEKTYDDFCSDLPPNECRYGMIDLDTVTNDGRKVNKLVFITWTPDCAKIKNKMVYAGSKEALKSALPGVGIQVQATDAQDLDFEESIKPAMLKFN
mmetsp:Transcript_29100/g.66695  ORF Transcript_29100/g.66695 Transcript_29100/m.66695 type:complete len:144 (-) Transcript_29100:575-1006(-)|eukprot:CAMPEP_0113312908 /NCGR_PEP_ID=MMETSP0010_2-20120614/9550_1 /TAXON_ID=216773 ORGANISM="Corethron hystrix, Strain 308" /NCGR_SAMPLE_ID=MMETSP0010_2 /ASSEMBLY_ACC=CAM_ASM_000155 /LENGTH=143 /DNA_ID=CAMNT_0000168827 /DNA_START=218 /DNA_END=649 /DNA_ORIENTATION=- /assembly_acc=CAM_ASM_000155